MRLLNRGALVALLCSLVVGSLTVIDPELFGLEHVWSDRLTRFVATKERPDPRILIVAINDRSRLTLDPIYGRWPWDREVMARIVEEAREGGARVVAFDVSFLGANTQGLEGDERFAVAMASMPVILGVQTAPPSKAAATPAVPRELAWDCQGAEGEQFRLFPPFEKFRPSAGVGTMRYISSRRYFLADRVGPAQCIPSLALAAAAAYEKFPRRLSSSQGKIALGSLTIDSSDAKSILLRWHGAKRRGTDLSYDSVDAVAVVQSSFAAESPEDAASLGIDRPAFLKKFKDRIVIVGATAQGMVDLRPTPLSLTTAGVEIHANAVDNLVNRDWNRDVSPIGTAFALILITTLFGAFVYLIDSQIATLVVMLVTAGGWLMASYIALLNRFFWPAVGPVIAIAAAYGAITVIRFIAEQRSGVQLKRTFGRYVSPQILDHILEHPEKVELGGERREMTILFSDIRGFTSISEASEPEEVVEMLNEYLTEMVDILLEHGGTLDKFIGDAVMGFWNAPTEDPDHARRAVACAVDMIDATARIRERWEKEGKAAIRIGIGINSGEAVVGNIGSSKVFGYTVIGDAVNLASRLEGKNKDYGTEIIISDSTLERIGNEFVTSYLDEVKVKGKEKAVKIYEVKGRLS
jgi:adenylate cyclase